MTTLSHRPATGLLVIDVQNDVMRQAYQRDTRVATMAAVVEQARAAGVPVIWVQHSDAELVPGSLGWAYVPELQRRTTEPLVPKLYGDAFEDTSLEQLLAEAGVGHVVVLGAETDACIRSTLHGAFTRGYDVTLVGDAHTTSDLSAWGAPPPELVIAHTNLYWDNQKAPGRTAAVVVAQDIRFDV